MKLERRALLSSIALACAVAACESKTGGLWGPINGFSDDQDSGDPFAGFDGGGNSFGKDSGQPQGIDAGAPQTPLPCTELAGTPTVGTWTKFVVSSSLQGDFSPATIGAVDAATGDVYFITWNAADRFVVRYQPSKSTLTEMPMTNAPSGRDAPIVGIAEGRLYVFGGTSGGVPDQTGGYLDLSLQTWTALPMGAPALETQSSGPPTAKVMLAYPGRVAFFASSPKGANTAAVGLLDVAAQTWSTTLAPNLPLYRCDSLAVGANNVGLCSGLASDIPISFQYDDAGVTQAGFSAIQGAPSSSAIWSTFAGNSVIAWNAVPSSAISGSSQAYRSQLPNGAWTPMRQFLERDLPYVMTVNQKVVVWNGKGVMDRNDGLSWDPSTSTWSPISCGNGPSTSTTAVSDGTRAYVVGNGGAAIFTLTL